jgi:hypothetical protein
MGVFPRAPLPTIEYAVASDNVPSEPMLAATSALPVGLFVIQ